MARLTRYALQNAKAARIPGATLLALSVMLPLALLQEADLLDWKQSEGFCAYCSPHLRIYRKTAGISEIDTVHYGDWVSRGDLLQLAFRPPQTSDPDTHGIIFSLDLRGELTLHFPKEHCTSTSLSRKASFGNRYIPLPYSFELDDAPGFEHFFFVVSERPIDTAALFAHLRNILGAPCRLDKYRRPADPSCYIAPALLSTDPRINLQLPEGLILKQHTLLKKRSAPRPLLLRPKRLEHSTCGDSPTTPRAHMVSLFQTQVFGTKTNPQVGLHLRAENADVQTKRKHR